MPEEEMDRITFRRQRRTQSSSDGRVGYAQKLSGGSSGHNTCQEAEVDTITIRRQRWSQLLLRDKSGHIIFRSLG